MDILAKRARVAHDHDPESSAGKRAEHIMSGGEVMEKHLRPWGWFMRVGGQRGWPGERKKNKWRMVALTVNLAAACCIFYSASAVCTVFGLPGLFAVSLTLVFVNAHAKALCLLLQMYPLGNARPPADDAFDNLKPKAVRLVQFAIYGGAAFIAIFGGGFLMVSLGTVVTNHPESADGQHLKLVFYLVAISGATPFWLGATATYYGICAAMALRFLDLRDEVREAVELVAPARMVSVKAIRALQVIGNEAQAVPTATGDGNETSTTQAAVRSVADSFLTNTLTRNELAKRLSIIREEYALLTDTLRGISRTMTGYVTAAEFFLVVALLPLGWMVMNGEFTAKGYDGQVPVSYRHMKSLYVLGILGCAFIPSIALSGALVTWAAESVPATISRLAKARSEELADLQQWMLDTEACFKVFDVRISFGTALQIFYIAVTTITGAIIYYSESAAASETSR